MIPTQKISLIVPADPIRSIRGTKFILCRPDDKVRHYRLVNAYLCLETHEIGQLNRSRSNSRVNRHNTI